MAKTAADYHAMLLRLLPRGIIWDRAREGRIGRLLEAFGQELSRLEGDAARAIVELTPATSTEALEDWEAELGLPDECAPDAQTLDERRAAVIRKLQRGLGMDKGFYLRLLREFGFENVAISEHVPMMCDHGRADDLLFSDWGAHAMYVSIPNSVTLQRFRTGSSRNPERLLDWQETGIECVIAREKPAHVRVIFNITNPQE